MDLLERLRPKWRHSDPDVRAAAVRDMGADDRERLATIATGDPDARVRRLAIRKLDDAMLLDRVATSDADPALRDLAAECAREVRVRVATSAAPEAECAAALARLTDDRSIAQVAMTAVHGGVRHAALARVSGERLLRDVVRGASDPDTRGAALARITDAAVLRAIAVGDAPPDVALLALERIADVEVLRAVAETRTASKAVRQRAQAMLPSGAGQRPAGGGRDVRVRQLELCTAVEGLRRSTDVLQAAEQVREAQREWRGLAGDTEPRPEVAERFDAACEAVLERAGSLARRIAEAGQAREAVARSLHARLMLCERVEALDGGEALQGLEEARAAWNELDPVPDADGAPLARRFEMGVEACRARHAEWTAQAELRAELDRIVATAERLAAAGGPPANKAWRALERQWRGHAATRAILGDMAPLEARFAAAAETLARRREESAAQRTEIERTNLTRLEALCTRLGALATAERVKHATARRHLQEAEATLRDLGPLPDTERRSEWVDRLTAARDELARRVAREAETEEWRRWANVGAQEELIARVEGLLASEDLAEATRQLGGLQDEWASIATASPEKSQALWERFRTVREQLRRRCDAYMAENLEKKRVLCAQTAGVAESTDWNATAELVRRLQAEWKAIGPVPPRHAGALWRQFREPCDRFFARRKEHFGRIDAERSANAASKIALCEKAEALAESTDWDETAAVVKQLQAEWKRTGPPPRAQADQLWQRFRSACDRFFDRRNRREELERDALLAKAEALCGQLEAMAASLEGDDAPDDAQVGQTLDAAWAEWLRLDLVALEAARAVRDRLDAAVIRLAAARPASLGGTRLDPERTRARRETLCARMEALIPSAPEAPRALSLQEMALALRERLATNTIAARVSKEPARAEGGRADGERLVVSWARLGPLLDDAARALAERFERARAQVPAASR